MHLKSGKSSDGLTTSDDAAATPATIRRCQWRSKSSRVPKEDAQVTYNVDSTKRLDATAAPTSRWWFPPGKLQLQRRSAQGRRSHGVSASPTLTRWLLPTVLGHCNSNDDSNCCPSNPHVNSSTPRVILTSPTYLHDATRWPSDWQKPKYL